MGETFVVRRWVMRSAVVALTALLIWANQAELDEIARGNGKVIPVSQVQVMQSLEGGLLKALLVRQGDVVDAGQIVAKIDDTRFSANLDELQSRRAALELRVARLSAEALGSTGFVPPTEAARLQPELAETELAVFSSRFRELRDHVTGLQESIRLAERELALKQPLTRDGTVSEIEILTLQRSIADLRVRLSAAQNGYTARAAGELADAKAELDQLRESLRASSDRVARTTLTAPVHGIVNRIHINTVGGVIQPGADIIEIVPLEDSLRVEARVSPVDIAFIHPGQLATIKITAYDFAIYGGIPGEVVFISADGIEDERGEYYFSVHVVTSGTLADKQGQILPITPGMTAQIDILTGRKSVLDYLLKPIRRGLSNAFTER